MHHLDEVCEEFWDSDPKLVKEGLDPEKHRWYEITTNVYRIGDRFIGVRGPSQMYSESSSWEDLYTPCVAFEMDEIRTVSYREIGKN